MSDLFPERIETDRLVLERLCRGNVGVDEFYRIASRHEPDIEEITQYLTWNPHRTPEETRGFFDFAEEQWNEGTAAVYAIRPREGEGGAGELAGNCALTIDWERRTGELGTWLRKPFWGRGYSGERAAALADLAFDRLDLEVLAVSHDAGNGKSRRAIEKYVEGLGGQSDALVRNGMNKDGETIDKRRYTVTREQWRAANPS